MSRTVCKIDPTRYKRLLSRTMPVVIESEEENERMLTIVDKGEDLSPEEEVSTSRRVLAFNVARSLQSRLLQPAEASVNLPGSESIV